MRTIGPTSARLSLFLFCASLMGCSQEDSLALLVGELAVAPAQIDFGVVLIGERAASEITLTNDGSRDVEISRVVLLGGEDVFGIGNVPAVVARRGSITVPVAFLSQRAGAFADVISIEHDADDATLVRIPLSARAVDPCVDADLDGYGDHCPGAVDCDDTDPTVNPGATELCNGLDDDCDGVADDGFDAGEACTTSFNCPSAACVLRGVAVCLDDGSATACEITAPEDLCDGIDNDCNCVVDDDYPDIGGPCVVAEGGCDQPGWLACAADQRSVTCVPDSTQAPQCCPPGLTMNPQGDCCPTIPSDPCDYVCHVDMVTGTHDCAAPVVVVESLDTQYGRLNIHLDPDNDASNGALYNALELSFEVCDPVGYALHLADSSGCNGHKGDGSTFSNDSELHFGTGSGPGTTLAVYSNDYAPTGESTLLSVPDFVAAGACSTRELWVSDQIIRSSDSCFEVESPYGLRIYPPTDDEGVPDAIWYLGLNRVVSGTSRTGSGLRWAEICLQGGSGPLVP